MSPPAVPPDAVAVELSVPFHEVDSLEVVWHGHYVRYLEAARMELERRRNLDVPELKRLGYHFMVAQTHLKHVAPLRYNDRVRVSAWVTECTFRLEFEYEVFNLTSGKRAATGRSVLVVMNDKGEMCMRTPDVIRERIVGRA